MTARIDAMAEQLSGDGGLLAFEPDQARLVLRLLRTLAAGAPVSAGQVAALACDQGIAPRAADRMLRRFTEWDDQDAVTGFLGLSLNDHPHRFTVNGVTLSTWCALDTLFLPAMLGQTATVESASPRSGTPVRLTVSPAGVTEMEPATVVLSVVVIPAEEERLRSPEAIWTAFCHQVHFFATRAEAEIWSKERPDIEILSPDEGFALGQQLFARVLAYADDAAVTVAGDGRRAPAPARSGRLATAERGFHHALLRAFPELGGPPDGAWLSREATARGLSVDTALAALVAEDLVQRDAATGAIVVAYPFSGLPTPHQVEVAGGKPVYAMCAIDALGIPVMLGRDASVRSYDPITGEPIVVTVYDDVAHWEPDGAVVFAGAVREEGVASERQCPVINFFASRASAEAYERAHPELTNVHILDQVAAARSAICSFGAMFAAGGAGACEAQRCCC